MSNSTRDRESTKEEVDEMLRSHLCEPLEIKFIFKKREAFDCKIHSVSRKLEDFEECIEFESVLLNQIRSRRNNNKIAEKISSVEIKILKRIKAVYELGLQKLPNEFKLHLNYFKFCSKNNFVSFASAAIATMTKNFAHNPEVFQVAAAWQAYDRKNVTEALSIIYKGICLHESAPILYMEACKLELFNVKAQEHNSIAMICDDISPEMQIACTKISKLLNNVFLIIKNISFYADLLKLLDGYSYTKSVQDTIVKKLRTSFWDDEMVWETLADRALGGAGSDSDENNDSTPVKIRLGQCVHIYEEGLQVVSVKKRAALWGYFLDRLLALQQSNSIPNCNVEQLLRENLEKAEKDKIALDEKYYIAWIDVLKDKREVDVILEKGTKALPKSVELWKIRLKHAIMKGSNKGVHRIYLDGVAALSEHAIPLWMMIIRFYSLEEKNEEIQKIFEAGIQAPSEVSQILKPLYVQWLTTTISIQEARRVYNLIGYQRPFSKELHEAMLKLEASQMTQNLNATEQVHRLVCEQFGKEDQDLWLSYADFCILSFDGDERIAKLKQIRKQAELALPPLLHASFNEKFSELLLV